MRTEQEIKTELSEMKLAPECDYRNGFMAAIEWVLQGSNVSTFIKNLRGNAMLGKYDDKTIKLTKGYIDAIKNLMIEEIKMMRKVDKEHADCWEVGVCTISDLSVTVGISFMFGKKEDLSWMKQENRIVVIYNKRKHGV